MSVYMGVVWYVVILLTPTSDERARTGLRGAGGCCGESLGPIRGPGHHWLQQSNTYDNSKLLPSLLNWMSDFSLLLRAQNLPTFFLIFVLLKQGRVTSLEDINLDLRHLDFLIFYRLKMNHKTVDQRWGNIFSMGVAFIMFYNYILIHT